jgi:UDP-N-acetylmuramoyl-L-alanyl-D-glutamate--2,6-diaminopimelate ligase
MKLKELLAGVEIIKSRANLEMDISQVAYDSRKVIPGSLFVAVTGFVTDGNKYIPMALEKGAAAAVTAIEPTEDIPYILVSSDRLALAQIAANWYDHPADAMQIIGITGTNGKTSSTLLLKHILEVTRGAKVGLIGTMDNRIGEEIIPTERTTPESLELQELFARMRSAGCQYVIMEVSSQRTLNHNSRNDQQ